ncbi:DUF3192 domain-containing protein [Rheinheimera sp. NSM]|uniref:DUF3192 domain-containing protein n=1 Tax=Rheinheimera sp. NSM TaxID=3457884 RepID=UPI004037376A
MLSIKSRKLTFFLSGLGIYLLLTLAVLFWYQDDVEQMNWVDREVFNHKIISSYSTNANIQQQDVMQRLGSPDITTAVQHNGTLYQLLYYRTHRSVTDGITTADECTALLFKNRRLIALGEPAVAQYQAIAANGG